MRTGTTCSPTSCTPGLPSTEVCDGLDNDCNGVPDDGLPLATCGVGRCMRTGTTCNPSSCTPGTPIAEVCNGMDDNCDGVPDNGAPCPDGQSCMGGACVALLDAGLADASEEDEDNETSDASATTDVSFLPDAAADQVGSVFDDGSRSSIDATAPEASNTDASLSSDASLIEAAANPQDAPVSDLSLGDVSAIVDAPIIAHDVTSAEASREASLSSEGGKTDAPADVSNDRKADGSAADNSMDNMTGCGCRAFSSRSRPGSGAWLLMLAAAAALRRRRVSLDSFITR
jgi:MYXO-CTERM domain-containing protein